MVMITCPNCGQHVLDVASACPKCGHVLMQNALETGDDTRLTPCRRCGKHIDRDASRCPFCGHHVRRSRLLRHGAGGLAAVAVVAAGVVLLVHQGILPSPSNRPSRGEPAAAAAPRAAPPRPDTVVRTAPIVVAPPETSAPRAAPPAASVPVGLRVKWTTEWANVRADRTVTSPVVRVLAPGARVEIGDLESGWWALYEGGAAIGYVANSLLSDAPPGP
jgi:ribosomal protein L37E